MVERNLAIVAVTVIAGAFYHFALLTAVLKYVGVADLFDFERILAWVALSYFLAAALRIFAGGALWWVEPSGRVLYLISVVATVLGTLGVTQLFVVNLGTAIFLVAPFPPLVIAALLFRGRIAELFEDQVFQTVVKTSTRSKRPYDGVFWIACATLLLFSGLALAFARELMN